MKRPFLVLASLLLIQPLSGQVKDGFSNAGVPASEVTYAPLHLSVNGGGTISARQRGETLVDGQLLPVGSTYVLAARAERGYRFAGWTPMNVFTTVMVVTNSEGQAAFQTNIVANPQPEVIGRSVLRCTVQPESLVTQTPLLTITTGQGWQANFLPRTGTISE